MKRFSCFLLSVALLLFSSTLTGCASRKNEALRLGLGLYTSAEATNATEDRNGLGDVAVTGAAVLLDGKNKIVSCVLDCAEHQISYTADGKTSVNDSFLTKREQGDSYGMKAHGGALLEWYEQADAFCMLVKGKTIEEVKALVSSDGKGTDEVIRAGCTISVSDFVKAIEKAAANAAPTEAAAKDTLRLGAATIQKMGDATASTNGTNQLETTFFAATTDKNGKITSACSDCAEIEFAFDINGVSQNEGKWIVSSKKDAGDAYGMKLYGGAALEWYEQARVFDNACIGKTASNISSLLGSDGYGSSELTASGCTISVSGFIKAASKIG